MANSQWLTEFPNSEVIFHRDDTSEHYPGLLKFFEMQHVGSKAFRFFDMWTTDPHFMVIVQDIWNQPIQGTKMYYVSKKLE